MNGGRITSSILLQVLPEDSIAGYRFECCSMIPRLIAVDELAPTLAIWCIEDGEVGSSSS